MEKKKTAYNSYEEAMAELERILNTNFKPWKKEHRKPCRIFQNKRDGLFYLTSKINVKTY